MKRVLLNLLASAAALPLLFVPTTLHAQQQDYGNWRAANQTAKSITGDLAFAPEKLYINFSRFTMSRIRPLEAAEVASVFEVEGDTAGTGNLYRISIPGDQKFLHKNTLCGSEETQWVATYAEGKTLKLAFFSNAKPPVFKLEEIQNSPNLCGTFLYVR